jgi:transposase
MYLYAYVQPTTGEVEWHILPTVSTQAFQRSLEEFAKYVGAGPKKRILLMVDGAGFHRGKDLVIPEGIHLVFQPPYSPELQPAERLWPLVHESMANRPFMSLDELEEVLIKRCVELLSQTERVRSHTLFRWWLEAVSA